MLLQNVKRFQPVLLLLQVICKKSLILLHTLLWQVITQPFGRLIFFSLFSYWQQ